MFPYYLLPGNRPKPKPKKPSSYLPSYITVYVKPDPPAEDAIPNDIVAIVGRPPSDDPRPPVAGPSTPQAGSGVHLPDGTPVYGVSMPSYDPRPDVSQAERPNDDSDSERTRPGRIVEELQDQRPDYSDGYGQAIEDAYKDENGIYFQLYMNQGTVRKNDFAESGQDEESDWHALLSASGSIARSIDRYMNGLLQHGQEKSESEAAQQNVIKDVTNDKFESLTALDMHSGDELYVRYGGPSSTTMQGHLVDETKDRKVVWIHNHPNNTGASKADREAAFEAGVQAMMVVTPAGFQYPYIRGQNTMAPLKPIFNSDYIAAPSLLETVQAFFAYVLQSAAEADDPAEWVLEQEGRDPRIHKQSFQSRAAPIDPDYVRYTEPNAPEGFLQNLFYNYGQSMLREDYMKEAGVVSVAGRVSGNFGYDDARHHLLHFLDGSGDPIDDLPVDKMIDELPLFRADIIQNVRDSLAGKLASGELEPIDVSEDTTTYAFPTEWRFVGSEGKSEADIYGFGEKPLDSGYDTFDMLTANPPEGVEQAVYDWNLALGKFYYSVRVNVTVNNATQEAKVVMQIVVQDRYAWYKNEDVGEVNHQMADLELEGLGRNFAISGESSVIEVSFNWKRLEAGRDEPLFDWPEDG